MQPDALIAFVKARLDEDEVVAREACDGDSGQWFMGRKWNVYRAEDEARYDEDYQGEENRLVVYGNVKPQSEYVARHDPARALREVAAKRALIRVALENAAETDSERGDGHDAGGIAAGQCSDHGAEAALRNLAPLAAIWDGHPDYDPGWKP